MSELPTAAQDASSAAESRADGPNERTVLLLQGLMGRCSAALDKG